MTTKKAFWLSYDLGLKGDYAGLYRWLDSVNARECGDSIAFFSRSYDDEFIASLKKDISQNVNLSKTDRIYLIYVDTSTKKPKGNFIFGGRKRSPWEGFATGIGGLDEDDV